MAYQNVGTPRFYVDHGLWLYTSGVKSFVHNGTSYEWGLSEYDTSFIQLNPSNIQQRGESFLRVPRISPINYIAFLGTEDSATSPVGYYPEWYGIYESADDPNDYGSTYTGFTEIVNCSGYDNSAEDYNGFSMATFDDNPSYPYLRGVMSNTARCGAVSIGSYYDMPHSPDLNLTMTREYGGVKTIETKGGASLSNSFYRGSPAWGEAGAWELYKGTPSNLIKALSRSGRRVWDLSFSYLQDSDVFAPTESLISKIFDTDGYDDMWYQNDNHAYGQLWDAENRFLAHDNFFSQVIHKTNGGQLPFIFQPDKDNNNPDQFAIAKLDMNSFKFEQVANGVYNVKLKIREVW